MQTNLIGLWKSDENDKKTYNNVGKVTITFTDDGKLIYDIYEGDTVQRINLVYRVYGNIIITDQPSHPREEETRFRFENENVLILEFAGEEHVYIRSHSKSTTINNFRRKVLFFFRSLFISFLK